MLKQFKCFLLTKFTLLKCYDRADFIKFLLYFFFASKHVFFTSASISRVPLSFHISLPPFFLWLKYTRLFEICQGFSLEILCPMLHSIPARTRPGYLPRQSRHKNP